MSFSDLPAAHAKVCCCDISSPNKKEKDTPDHRLVNWQKWMQERKRLNQKMGKAIDRHAEQLLSNYGEDLYAINQEKKVLESTNITYPYDRYRGNPSFWRLPLALGRKPCDPCRPDYFSVMTSEQKCQIPKMEYVNVPHGIREEKDSLTVGYRNDKKVWDASQYRKARTKELDTEIKAVEPYKPDLGRLFVKGVTIEVKPEGNGGTDELFPQVPSTVLTTTPPTPIDIHDNEDFLQINDCRLCKHTSGDINVYLSFEYNLSKDNLLTQTLNLQNGSSYALRYYLTPIKKFYLFHDIVKETQEEEVFFYDKRELVMLPNQSFEWPISFRTDFPSTYKLQLTLNIRPKLWDCSFIINLTSVATYGDLPERCENIKKRLETEACEDIVRDTIQDILEDIPPQTSSVPTFYIYDKATIFEAINQDFTPRTRRPRYLYNKEVVEELEEFYGKMCLKDSPPIWNLNIKDLREITQRKQQEEYRKHFFEELAAARDKESKEDNVPESRSLIKTADSSRQSKLRSQLSTQERKTFGHNYLEELEDILIKLQQPSMWINENKTLFESCYSVMCTYFDALISEVQKLESDLNIVKREKYPAQYTYDPNAFRDRLQEIHEELAGQSPRIKEDFIREANPLAECLKGIPFSESDVRYKIYYGIVDEPLGKDKKGKGKKGKADKGKKKDKKDNKDKKGKGKKEKTEEKSTAKTTIIPDISLKENPDFNLFEEIPIEPSQSVKVSTSSEGDVSSGLTSGFLLQEYKRGLYDIFYRNLSEASVKLVDVIELHKRDKVRIENIKRMLEETSSKQRPVQMRVVDLKEAIRLAMNLPTKYASAYSRVCEKPSEMQIKYAETVYAKEEGSKWSILEPFKMPSPSDKPISYPETNVYLKKKMSKRMAHDVGTIMSNTGIDPNWTDYKDIGVQITSKWEGRAEKEDFMYNMISEVVDDICLEEAAARHVGMEEEGDKESALSTPFYSEEDLSNIPEKPVWREVDSTQDVQETKD